MKLNALLKTLRKETGSTSAEDSALTKIDTWYDTGSYALNRVITGDIHKGIPKGRIVTIYGDSQSGKSLIAAQTAANALRETQIDKIFFVDSEGGGTQILENMDVNMADVEYIPVNSIEQCSVQMLKLYDTFIKAKEEYIADPEHNDDIRAVVILDSWGALSANKLVNDAVEKSNQVQDMGLSAKLKNNLISGLMMRTLQSGVTLIIINHTYDNPGAMFASKIKPLPGGKKLEYASHVILQSTKLLIKTDNKEFLTGHEDDEQDTAFYKGNKLNFFCTKNRICKPCFSANVYIDFDTGMSKYDGLIDDAVAASYIEKVHGGYIVPSYSDKRITYKTLVSSDAVWNTFIEKFNADSIEQMKFSKAIVDQIKEAEGIITDVQPITADEDDEFAGVSGSI